MSDRQKAFFSIVNLRDYLVQVSLIILSLLIAVGVDRCNQGVKNDHKLEDYLAAIHEEMVYELASCRNNIADCQNDIKGLRQGVMLVLQPETPKMTQGMVSIAQVFSRGVFRSFSPTSFELMLSAGDAFLIEDLELRSALASAVAFRDDYIRRDLWKHDELTSAAIAKVAAYIDLECLKQTEPAKFAVCITNQAQARSQIKTDLSEIIQHAEVRLFHLKRFETQLEHLLPSIAAAMSTAPAPPETQEQ